MLHGVATPRPELSDLGMMEIVGKESYGGVYLSSYSTWGFNTAAPCA
jgi:hypothetical protein